MERFSQYDTILAVRGNGDVIHKGFFLNSFPGRNLIDSYKTIYMLKTNWVMKKFYGKKKSIKIYSTRLVLTEKINFVKKPKVLDF
jgi:hypothetical protein